MIDEKKLIEDMMNNDGIDFRMDFNTDTEESVLESLREFADKFRQGMIELVHKQPRVGEWIPCSERLPENYETVNITWVNRKPVSYYEHIKDKPFTGTANFHYGKWYWYSCVCEDYLRDCGDSEFDRMEMDIEVVAWMPLPEPYKE